MKMLFVLLVGSVFAFAKDKDITIGECPAPVRATIAEYAAKFTFEKVEIEKDSVPTLYGARFVAPDGRRFEMIMGADGKVQRTELKKPEKPKKEKEKAPPAK